LNESDDPVAAPAVLAPPAKVGSDVRLRLLSGIILAPLVFGVVYLGGSAFAAVVALVVATGLYEWLKLVDPAAPLPDRCGLYGSLALTLLLIAVGMPSLSIVTLAMATTIFYVQRSNNDLPHSFWFAVGLPYMAGSGLALIYLRDTPVIGLGIIAYLLAVVWGMDIGAYFTGRLIGGPKLWPSVSPNKTWSGFIGGCVVAFLAAWGVLVFTHAASHAVGLVVAVLLAAVSQGGDLFKSFFKRRAGVKDSGNLIPGHGGILDRIDGLVFAALLLAFLQAIFGRDMIW